ncbi:MAG TPA: DNA methyltransferase, partial [Planctomycetaceae bacterium]|nr:DNA methyltransferase [Planctomycetaceae bacterium]
QDCTPILAKEQSRGAIQLPELRLERGYNTRQAMNYGFCAWRDFFNDRQLLALGWLRRAIAAIDDESVRWPLMTLFSGILEFNNLFASYKGEGTGAVRHMFSHHILKPERMTIEANVWGTRKSSGSFLNLFQSRLLRAIDYRETPTEVNGKSGSPRECAPPFSGEIGLRWPTDGRVVPRGIYLSCGDSAATQLPDRSIDIVVTDPPFFDNVHYSELADFFYAWQQLPPSRCGISAHPHGATTRRDSEVQDSDAARFADKLKAVFCECRRILKDDGLLVFTYHHSRDEGWHSLAESILGAGFVVVNAQPVKAELSVATPKFQAKEPIQLDIIIVCRKQTSESSSKPKSAPEAMQSALEKMARLRQSGFSLSRNDRKIILYGQLLTTLTSPSEKIEIPDYIDAELDRAEPEPMAIRRVARQKALFTD